MYRLELTEHFEDWYVADTVIGEFDSLDDAVVAFCSARKDVIEMKEPAHGIENCIAENFELGEDDEDISDYSKGFVLKVQQDDDDIVSQYFAYDHISKSISESCMDDFNREYFSAEQLNLLENQAVNV
ncbi:MAG: hypothetical protein AB7Y74_08050 [Syntrophorhabdus sp.]